MALVVEWSAELAEARPELLTRRSVADALIGTHSAEQRVTDVDLQALCVP
jgi:hypothetical protein